MKGGDEGNVGATQQTIVEHERRYDESVVPALRYRLHEYRNTKIEMPVVLTENDFVRVPFEYPKNVYPVTPLSLEIT